MLIDKGQFLRHIHIAIEIDIAVGGMIEFPVEIQEFFVGQLGDCFRITSGFAAVGGVRIQGIHDLPLQHIIRRGKSTLHLVINHTVDFQLLVVAFQLIMPAFLSENRFVFVNIRVKNRIQIDMHQVLEIFVIAAGHGVYSLVRIGHGI